VLCTFVLLIIEYTTGENSDVEEKSSSWKSSGWQSTQTGEISRDPDYSNSKIGNDIHHSSNWKSSGWKSASPGNISGSMELESSEDHSSKWKSSSWKSAVNREESSDINHSSNWKSSGWKSASPGNISGSLELESSEDHSSKWKSSSWKSAVNREESSGSLDSEKEDISGSWKSKKGKFSSLSATKKDVDVKEVKVRMYRGGKFVCSSFRGEIDGPRGEMEKDIKASISNAEAYFAGENTKGSKYEAKLPYVYRMTFPPYPTFTMDTCVGLPNHMSEEKVAEPTVPGVFLRQIEPGQYFYRSFQVDKDYEGRAWGKELERLKSALMLSNVEFESDIVYGVSYSPPGATGQRRNDVMFRAK